MGSVEGADVEYKKNRAVKNNSKDFGLRNWEISEATFTEMVVFLSNEAGERYETMLAELTLSK